MSTFFDRRVTFKFSFTLGQLVLVLGVLLFFAYLCWEVYWFKQVGYNFIKWHTRIVFTSLLTGFIFLTLNLILALFFKGENLKKAISISIGCCIGLVVLETAYLFLDKEQTYSEIRNGFYQSPFKSDPFNPYHINKPNSKRTFSAPEFAFPNNYNSLGFAGKEWPIQKEYSKRIIILGDSFTEGDGAPQDSSFPMQLQQFLGKEYEVLNAGVRGSDPVFGVKNMEDRLLKYKPDLVVQTLCENDVLYDFCIRGGFERYLPNGTMAYHDPPFWEPIYAISSVGRMLLGNLGVDLSKPCGDTQKPALIKERNQVLFEVFDRFEKLGKSNNFTTLILFFPKKNELAQHKYDYDFSAAKKKIDELKHVKYIVIFGEYQQQIASSHLKTDDFYWKMDSHHNAKGYKLMAKCVFESLKKNGFLEKNFN